MNAFIAHGSASSTVHPHLLYEELERTVLPLFHAKERARWVWDQKGAITRNAATSTAVT
jgi:hypothetical protein